MNRPNAHLHATFELTAIRAQAAARIPPIDQASSLCNTEFTGGAAPLVSAHSRDR